MRKFFLVLVMCAAWFIGSLPAFAGDNLGLTCEEFLTRLANVSFRVPYGFTGSQIMDAEHNDECVLLSRNGAIFITINETPPPKEVKNISAVLITQIEDIDRQRSMNAEPGDNIVFESICKQIIHALHPSLKDDEAKRLIKELGMRGEALDGVQRSLRFESRKYIAKYNENGMLIMVVSSL